jgi:(3R)-3-hydroxyacyl-CoA dehydrogenase / 3a,7a,12a-trihydroxy-5b-cholest-24-enoyl-CoA hydratase / enoyl-CoA hydratase 2
MTAKLRFDGRVVVITGGGSGLGRAYALEFGKRGAKLVINDLGGSVRGEGNSKSSADSMVEELKSLGVEAVANYDSVENGENIIKTAIDTFGRVDVLINNAGILKELTMLKMTAEDWDLAIKVHLKGSFSVSRAAWKYMREHKFGRIINTSSGSGIYGNFGQANYSAAKMGLHGLTQTLAKEGEKYDIRVNSIAPVAASRLTQDTFNPETLKLFIPEKIVPLVVYLSHESSQETGGLFEVAGGWVTKLRWQRGQGVFFAKKYAAEDIKKEWKRIVSFEGNNDYPSGLTDTLQKVMIHFENKPKI